MGKLGTIEVVENNFEDMTIKQIIELCLSVREKAFREQINCEELCPIVDSCQEIFKSFPCAWEGKIGLKEVIIRQEITDKKLEHYK